MILSDKQILEARERGDIVITPFDPKCLGSNSYDVRLGKNMAMYVTTEEYWDIETKSYRRVLDCKKYNPVYEFEIPEKGFILNPKVLYLGVTLEHTFTPFHVPKFDGKSSTGRIGIFTHITAGIGDIGFKGHWTLEITCVEPVRIYAGMPIGQITFETSGECFNPYNAKQSAKYNNEFTTDPKPIPYMGYKNFK
jgi:dCTP deaminase